MTCLGLQNPISRPLLAGVTKLCLMATLLCVSVLHGQNADTLNGLYHNRWTVREGAPSNIKSIAQAQDGYLWLGTDHGLFRFDGVKFDAYTPASGGDLLSRDVATVSADPRGGLWIGYESGGASYLKKDRLISYSSRDGLSAGAVRGFAINSEGTIWAATEYGLSRFQDSIWRCVGPQEKYPENYPNSIFFDSRGTLWASTDEGLLYLSRMGHLFTIADKQKLQNVGFAETKDGSVWVASTQGAVRIITDHEGHYLTRQTTLRYKSQGLLAGGDGTLWIMTVGKGIVKVGLTQEGGTSQRYPGSTETFTEQDGLTGNFAFEAIEDREKSVWIATTNGLDQFRKSMFTPVSLPSDSTYIAMVLDSSGVLMIGTDHFLRTNDGRANAVLGAPAHVECAYRDPHGVIWLGSPKGLWRLSGTHFVSIPIPKSLEKTSPSIQAMTFDSSDALWVSFVGAGIFRRAKGGWTRPSTLENLPPIPAISELTGADGRIWFGYTGNQLASIADGKGTLMTAADGVNVGVVSLISQISGQVWIGGKRGLEYLKEKRFWDLKLADYQQLRGVSGIVQGQDGDLWVNTISGIYRLRGADIRTALLDPSHVVHADCFGYLDGIVGTPEELRPLPTALRAPDGRLYFAMRGGVVWLDTKHLMMNKLPPPVWIKSILVDGHFHESPVDMRLPANSRNLVVDYSANSLLVPQRVHFRHILEGLDTQWQDAGTQRQAYYSRLPPGSYKFRVEGSNNDDVWNETGASVSFIIPPSFLQSRTFKLLCVAIMLGLLWLVYLIRVQQVTERLRSRLVDRMTEREQIARDLHDTFLQGVQGVLLSFHTATQMLHGNERPRKMLEDALTQSDEVMLEGRDMVMQLRGSAIDVCGLPDAFASVGNAFARDNLATFTLLIIGASREVHPLVRDDIYRIGREAVANAFHHAKASAVEMELTYGSTEFRLRVRDDGTGIDPVVMKAGGRENHWGMPGMRERTKKIGGHLDLWSSLKAGTEVDLRVPADLVYYSSLKRRRFRWLDNVLGRDKDRNA